MQQESSRKVSSLPSQVHYISFEVRGGGAGENDRRDEDAGEGASPHEEHRNTHMRRRQTHSEQSIQMCKIYKQDAAHAFSYF